jgi:hypothetical protein
MNGIPDAYTIPALSDWQLNILWATVSLAALGTVAVLVWHRGRTSRAHRSLRCPVTLKDADITLRLDPDTGVASDVDRCSLLEPPDDVTCSQSCLHPPKEAHPQPKVTS